MAFSTQKEFFHVPFKNETYDFECQEACVKLKSYPSTFDDRSWAANEDKKSRFVADLVACNTPVPSRRSQGDRPGPGPGAGAPAFRSASNKFPGDQGQGGGYPPQGAERAGKSPEEEYGSRLVVGDSLIQTADDTIGRMQDLMYKNNILERRLADSDDKLKTFKNENAEIKRIMAQRYDPEKSKALKRKIKELADDKKITPKDEKDLNDLQKSIDDMNKAHDILEAENANLKRLIEKQSKRCHMDSIKIDPERSNDIPYLQKKVDDLGKELALLRQAEDAAAGGGKNTSDRYSFSPDKDINNIQQILAERDALRKKCKSMEDLEKKVNGLQRQAAEAEHISGELADNLTQQNQYIDDMETEMQEMQKFYENEMEKTKCAEQMLKCRCDDMKKELMAAKSAAQRAECQQMEIEVLRNELRKRDVALNAYDCQYQQLMHKAKNFKNAGYRFLDDLPESCSDSCLSGADEEGENGE